MFDAGLFEFLSSAGTPAGERVYPMRLPQGSSLPAIVYREISPGIEYTQGGQSGVSEPRYQLDCWGADELAAKLLAFYVTSALSGYKGAMGSEQVQATFIEGRQDDPDPDTGRCRVIIDVVIQHRR